MFQCLLEECRWATPINWIGGHPSRGSKRARKEPVIVFRYVLVSLGPSRAHDLQLLVELLQTKHILRHFDGGMAICW